MSYVRGSMLRYSSNYLDRGGIYQHTDVVGVFPIASHWDRDAAYTRMVFNLPPNEC